MDTDSAIKQAPPAPRRITTSVRFVQWCIGFSMNVLLACPISVAPTAWSKLASRRRYILVCSHVSLLDTLFLGALVWRHDCCPILMLGDRHVWHASWVRGRGSFKPRLRDYRV